MKYSTKSRYTTLKCFTVGYIKTYYGCTTSPVCSVLSIAVTEVEVVKHMCSSSLMMEASVPDQRAYAKAVWCNETICPTEFSTNK